MDDKLQKGETFFVGKDVAKALGYSNTRKALQDHVDDEDKLTRQIVVSGQGRRIIFINESGLYSLILSSQLERAKTGWRRWVRVGQNKIILQSCILAILHTLRTSWVA